MGNEIKLVASDMDGTLLDDECNIPADFFPWVEAHRDILVAIASGRQLYTLIKQFERIKDKLIFLAENGAIVMEAGKIAHTNTIQKKYIQDLLDYSKTTPNCIPILCGVKQAYFPKEGIEEVWDETVIYYERRKYLDNLEDALQEDDILKVAIHCKNNSASECFEEWSRVAPRLKKAISGPNAIDITNKGVNKGAALKKVIEDYGILPQQCMAFGDYLNDVELLQLCEESYCMENGHPDLRTVAKHIASKNTDNGVMKVLHTL